MSSSAPHSRKETGLRFGAGWWGLLTFLLGLTLFALTRPCDCEVDDAVADAVSMVEDCPCPHADIDSANCCCCAEKEIGSTNSPFEVQAGAGAIAAVSQNPTPQTIFFVSELLPAVQQNVPAPVIRQESGRARGRPDESPPSLQRSDHYLRNRVLRN